MSVEPLNPIKVYSDHRNLEWFMTTKNLNRRQARWAEFLSEFNFKIMYRPGKQGEKPDALTRRPQDLPVDANDARREYQFQTVLKKDNVDNRVYADLACLAASPDAQAAPPPPPVNDLTHNPDQTLPEREQDENQGVPDTPHLNNLLDRAYETDDDLKELMAAVLAKDRKLPARLIKEGYTCHMGHLQVRNGRLFMKDQLFVPKDTEVRLRLMQLHHFPPRLGHPGYKSMFEVMSRNYYWPRMRQDLYIFVRACHTCTSARGDNVKKQGFLQPLDPPERRWDSVSFDFIEKLPSSRWKNENHRYILVMVDRLTKAVILEGLPDNSVDSLYEAVNRRLFSVRGLISNFVNDRGSAMIAKLWSRICEQYGIKIKYSSAHHPETDGQTEIKNKAVKIYLRMYVNYAQSNWMAWLPRAEFALNNHVSRSTGMSPFFANYGYHPRLGIEPASPNENQDPRIERADRIVARTKAMDSRLATMLRTAQAEHAYHANKQRSPHPNYKVGDRVWVDARDLSSSRPSKGLDWKFLGPWLIKHVIDHKAYELDIPTDRLADGLTPVFHPWKLRLAAAEVYPGQIMEPPRGSLIQEDDEDAHDEFEVSEVVDFRETRRFGVQYKATYVGQWNEWNANPPWQPWTDFLRSRRLVLDFHRLNPRLPPPPDGLLNWIDPEDGERAARPGAQGTSPDEGGGSVRPQPDGPRRRNPTRRVHHATP